MATITALVGTDGVTTANSMTKINANFANLNSDKIETSYLDTDTTLAANSDSKIATQKAVKAYVDIGGNVNASTTAKGIVEEATAAEISAGTAAGATGARLFVNPSTLLTAFNKPTVKLFYNLGSSTTRFDITNTAGDTYRYTYDATGNDPLITLTTVPIGTILYINGSNFNAANKGTFTTTGAGANYFEINNPSGVAENNVTIGTGNIQFGGLTWTKPSLRSFITVEVVGGGGGGGHSSGLGSGGGGAGGYSRESFALSALGSTEALVAGKPGIAGATGTGGTGGTSSFGSGPYLQATGGTGGTTGAAVNAPGSGGVGTGGDVNLYGAVGGYGISDFDAGNNDLPGIGGPSYFGGTSLDADGNGFMNVWGAGGYGARAANSGVPGNTGAVIITEY